jgi:hypothetical protein
LSGCTWAFTDLFAKQHCGAFQTVTGTSKNKAQRSKHKDQSTKVEMLDYAEPVTKLIDEFKRLPSIGQKSAQRLAFHILRSPEAEVERLIQALHEVKQTISECSVCNNLTDVNPCRFC